MLTRSFCLALTLLVPACGKDKTGNRPTAGDPALLGGERTLPNEEAPTPMWRLSETLSTIGVAQGRAEYEFHKIAGASIDASRRVVVADQGAAELRFFTIDGQFLSKVGRKGHGPGEYRSPRLLPSYAADSLVVFDQALHRISILDPQGEYVRSFTLTMPQWRGMFVRGRALGRLPDGDVLIQESGGHSPTEAGLARPPAQLARYSAIGGKQRDLGTFRGDAVYHTLYQGRSIFSVLPFLPKLLVAVGPDRIYLSEGPEFDLTALTPSGIALKRTLPHASGPLQRSVYDDWVETALEGIPPGTVEETRRFYENLYHPWPAQAVTHMITDGGGNLWVRSLGADSQYEWRVIGRDLNTIATVNVPADFIILSVRDNLVLGLVTDPELDYERLEVRTLVK